MRLFLFVIVYFATLNLSNAIELNQTVLFQTFNYNHESVYIDLHKESIVSIHLSSFIGLEKLEVLYLQDNRIKRIEKDVFKDLVNLRQLWLESNNIVSFDRDALLGLHNLELVCLNDNPIQELFQSNLIPICNSISNPKCVVKTTEKCVPESTIKPSTTKTEDRIEQLASFFQFDQLKQNEKILNLEEVQKVNNETLSKLLANSFQNNEKIENLQTTHLNDTKMLKEEWQFKYQNQDIKHSQLENKFKNQEIQIETLKKDQKATNETLSKLLVDVFQKLDEKIEYILKNLTGVNTQLVSLSKNLNTINVSLSNSVSDIKETLVMNNIKKKNITVYSLAQDISISNMKSQGYRVINDVSSSKGSSFEELNAIKLHCLPETILCAGGAATGSDNLLLVSCGKCHSVLEPTLLNRPVFNNGAYWYLTNKISFGFSPTYNIKQADADCIDCTRDEKGVWNYCADEKKLSWFLNGSCCTGVWRIGKLINLHVSSNHRRIIFLF